VPRVPHLPDAALLWGPGGGVRRVLGAEQQGLAPLGWQHRVLAHRLLRNRRLEAAQRSTTGTAYRGALPVTAP
jgi:hypothetical protein